MRNNAVSPTHYLRIEGVNLYRVLADTHDLSTARGGGLLLLQAVEAAFTALENAPGVTAPTVVTKGASIGLFSFVLGEGVPLENVRAHVESTLTADPQHRHFTFVVDVVAARAPESFRADVETLVALNRRRQIREPSVSVPAWNEDGHVWPDEDFDRIGPASEKVWLPPKEDGGEEIVARASRFVAVRREHGREQRKDFYRELGVATDNFFTDDLATLSTGAPRGVRHLDGKMAVLYTDGNRFSSIARACGEPGTLTRFDKCIRNNREAMLAALLEKIDRKQDARWWAGPRHGKHKGQPCRRLETLLWGADELIFVVPAWAGWELASWYFDRTRGWSFDGNELTHSGGLVFASHRAPIQRVIALAENLAQLAKDTIEQRGIAGRERNLLAYEVLESFDHIGGDVGANWRRRLRDSQLEIGDLLLRGAVLDDFWKRATELDAGGFPQRRLHIHARATLGGAAWTTTSEDESIDEWKTQLDGLAGTLAPFPDRATWLHLAQLWNYTAAVPYVPLT